MKTIAALSLLLTVGLFCGFEQAIIPFPAPPAPVGAASFTVRQSAVQNCSSSSITCTVKFPSNTLAGSNNMLYVSASVNTSGYSISSITDAASNSGYYCSAGCTNTFGGCYINQGTSPGLQSSDCGYNLGGSLSAISSSGGITVTIAPSTVPGVTWHVTAMELLGTGPFSLDTVAVSNNSNASCGVTSNPCPGAGLTLSSSNDAVIESISTVSYPTGGASSGLGPVSDVVTTCSTSGSSSPYTVVCSSSLNPPIGSNTVTISGNTGYNGVFSVATTSSSTFSFSSVSNLGTTTGGTAYLGNSTSAAGCWSGITPAPVASGAPGYGYAVSFTCASGSNNFYPPYWLTHVTDRLTVSGIAFTQS